MENSNLNNELPECRDTRVLFSDYIENTLSARDTWSVEKHLAECGDCSGYLHQMQATVQLLHAAPRYDTADDFMARLHQRLDGVEPEAMRSPSGLTAFREWLTGLGASLRNPRVPAFGLGLSALVLVAVVAKQQFTPQSAPTAPPTAITRPAETPPVTPTASTQQLHSNVAISASNPFEDAAAANLEAQSADSDGDDGDTSG